MSTIRKNCTEGRNNKLAEIYWLCGTQCVLCVWYNFYVFLPAKKIFKFEISSNFITHFSTFFWENLWALKWTFPWDSVYVFHIFMASNKIIWHELHAYCIKYYKCDIKFYEVTHFVDWMNFLLPLTMCLKFLKSRKISRENLNFLCSWKCCQR